MESEEMLVESAQIQPLAVDDSSRGSNEAQSASVDASGVSGVGYNCRLECIDCGSSVLVRTGTCYTCISCGGTTGCG